MHLADFIQSDLQYIHAIHFFVSMTKKDGNETIKWWYKPISNH